MEDAERDGGSCGENGCGSAGGVSADAERGVGSLATFVMGGASGGESAGADTGADAGAGEGALAVRVGRGTEAAVVDTAPVSRETSLSEMGLPVKNSPAVREGSIDGAGGKMSDWNESDPDWCACVSE